LGRKGKRQIMRTRDRLGWVLAAAVGTLALVAAPSARAQFELERTERFDVQIAIEASGAIVVRETIVQRFGSTPRHGIFRYIPVRLRYDDDHDRIYPLELLSVSTSPGTPDDVETSEDGDNFVIRIGDPDVEITGRHTYEIAYRVEGALNGFPTHDELYWNAIGDRWEQPIDAVSVRVTGPAPIQRVVCFSGPLGSAFPCGSARIREGVAVFTHQGLGAYNALSVAVALPPGTVASTEPILQERWSLDRAFARTPVAVGGAVGLLVLMVAGFGWLAWRTGRDVRFAGSQIDQVMGSSDANAPTQVVPLFERGDAPVEFGPPEGMRPGQIGTLIDERANTLDVTATIVDLAVRGYLVIEEIPKKGWFGKPDWRLLRLPKDAADLLEYERLLLDGLFEDGDEVLLSDLKKRFVERLKKVQDALYRDAVRRKWFVRRPDRVRAMWTGIGAAVEVAAIGATVVLARFTDLGLLGIPLILGGLLLLVGASRMPRRTARGTAMTRRVRGFRTVIEKAEEHMARWAEQENVFTRLLPYAVVFGVTEKWARAFEALGQAPAADTGWYRSPVRSRTRRSPTRWTRSPSRRAARSRPPRPGRAGAASAAGGSRAAVGAGAAEGPGRVGTTTPPGALPPPWTSSSAPTRATSHAVTGRRW
jgi:hypothetical protein